MPHFRMNIGTLSVGQCEGHRAEVRLKLTERFKDGSANDQGITFIVDVDPDLTDPGTWFKEILVQAIENL